MRREARAAARTFRAQLQEHMPLALSGPSGDIVETTLSEIIDEAISAYVNTPQVENFLEAVAVEARHQHERWGEAHDRQKTPADWFWLVGYLAGKALHLPEKRVHHIISSTAALYHWHCAVREEDRCRSST